ncbi:hypothetical protein FHS43_000575 [Streptosporangium becharense]|uniref:Minor tail protein n=1 Tax=Streptosporangium becharense TaxID=1816182 RepID=A0A7W9MKM7_9ACTN|nr:hypothetical protein [Streptosporangium becharense]MBB2909329.1 hypothetical protein [Streptosporangium becharense]MBB5823768.1 hypothetical protein [Streptosporangium becharense]
MTIRTLGLASGATSLQDHRLTLGVFMGPGASVLERRGGLYYSPGAADLVGVSALQATVSSFVAIVDGTSNALQGQIVVVVDANETLTFAAGEPAVARTDRVVVQVRDTTYDASGATDARVVIVKGNTTTGAANPVPASSLLLWEVVVPAGASAITFASARVDRRQWTATPLRIPVNSQTERNALPNVPGLEVTRLDTGDVEQWWGGAWRVIGGASSSGVLIARKTVNTDRTNTTTLTADPHLSVNLAANSSYLLDMLVLMASGATPGFRQGWIVPAGVTGTWASRHVVASTGFTGEAFADFGTTTVVVPGQGTPSPISSIRISGVVTVGATAGPLTYRWAQNTAGSGTTTVRADSYMRLEKLP